jgi:hypothetical protein
MSMGIKRDFGKVGEEGIRAFCTAMQVKGLDVRWYTALALR